MRGYRAKTRALQQANEALAEYGRLSMKTMGLLTVEEYIAQLARKKPIVP